MNRYGAAALVGLAALALSACAPATTSAHLTVTYTGASGPVTENIDVSDLTCRNSSVAFTITSEAKTADGKNVFVASRPSEERAAYVVALNFGDQWFASDSTFTAEPPRLELVNHAGFVSPPDGATPSPDGGIPATISGTVVCP